MADRKIDVHTHFLSPDYHKTLVDLGYTNPDGMADIPGWSPESHLAYMDEYGIEKSVLSISSPGTNLSPDADLNSRLARETNQYAASLKAQYPKRFGYFASLPMTDVSACLAEIKEVLDGPTPADGLVMMSNTLGFYLGDPHLRPILEELHSRKAVVFVHPTTPCFQASVNGQTTSEHYNTSSPLAEAYAAPLFEFFFDSGRSVLDLISTGTACRFNNIRWIASHCGGVLPPLIDRAVMWVHHGMPLTTIRDSSPVTESQIRSVLAQQFWFDMAGNPLPTQIDSLLKHTVKERLLFGSDVPWTPFDSGGKGAEMLDEDLRKIGFGDKDLEKLYWRNAQQLSLNGSK